MEHSQVCGKRQLKKCTNSHRHFFLALVSAVTKTTTVAAEGEEREKGGRGSHYDDVVAEERPTRIPDSIFRRPMKVLDIFPPPRHRHCLFFFFPPISHGSLSPRQTGYKWFPISEEGEGGGEVPLILSLPFRGPSFFLFFVGPSSSFSSGWREGWGPPKSLPLFPFGVHWITPLSTKEGRGGEKGKEEGMR